MTAENFNKAGEIFQNAIEIENPTNRADYLENACKDDEELRAEVEVLLTAHEQAGDFLEAPKPESNVIHSIEGSGTKSGRYELLELIGEGGMGIVYDGTHLTVERRVAIKCLHPEFARDPDIIKRFQREARAAAYTGNEHVVEVLDLDVLPNGSPFLVLVKQFCHRLIYRHQPPE